MSPRGERKFKKPARHKVMDLLARRDHSELELRQKLGRDEYTADEIDGAIELAKESRWLSAPGELAERVAISLGRKKKSHQFIRQFLKTKGLPELPRDAEGEFAKAAALVGSKWSTRGQDPSQLSASEWALARQKIQRLLTNRGFDHETIQRVIDSLRKRG